MCVSDHLCIVFSCELLAACTASPCTKYTRIWQRLGSKALNIGRQTPSGNVHYNKLYLLTGSSINQDGRREDNAIPCIQPSNRVHQRERENGATGHRLYPRQPEHGCLQFPHYARNTLPPPAGHREQYNT